MFKKTLTSLILTLVAFGGFFGLSIHSESEKVVLSGINQTYACSAADDWTNCPPQTTPKETQDAEMQKALNTVIGFINILLSILTIIVSPAIMLASWLMTPDWTAGDVFGIRGTLHDLWIVISNITYFIYAVLLIVVALATIFNSENYGYRKLLPKIALGIIMVPLTWWAVQWTISLATYVTASAVSVPAETLSKYTTGESWWENKIIPINMEYRNDKTYTSDGQEVGSGSTDIICKSADGKDNGKCLSPKEITSNASGLFSPLLIYSFGVFKIQDIKKIDTTTDAVKSILQIVHQGIIGALMFIIYGILIIALIFMLMMRAMKLWFYAIFSPLFTIKFVLGDKAFGDADKEGSFTISEFIGLAFVPAVVSLALSVGLIVVAALYTPVNTSSNPDNKCNGDTCTIKIMSSELNKIESKIVDGVSQTTVSLGGINYMYKGSVAGGDKVMPGLKSALGATGNLFGTIIIDIIALVFIWLAFMAGKGVSKAAGAAIRPFQEFGESVGKLGMKLPQYTPIPGTGGMSVKSLEKIPSMTEEGFRKRADVKFDQSNAGKLLKEWSGASDAVTEAKIREAVNQKNPIDVAKNISAVAAEMRSAGKGMELVSTTNREYINELSRKGITDTQWREHAGIAGPDAKKLVELLEKAKSGTASDLEYTIIAGYLAKAGKGDGGLSAEDAKTALKSGGSPSQSTSQKGLEIVDNDGSGGKLEMNILIDSVAKATIDFTQPDKAVGEIMKNEELKKYLTENMTETEFRRKLPSNLPVPQQNALIKKLQENGLLNKK